MLDKLEYAFFSLIRLGIGTVGPEDEGSKKLQTLSLAQWKKVMALAERQGVVAIAVDGLHKLYNTYGKEIKAASDSPSEWQLWVLESVGLLTQNEQLSLGQRKVVCEVSELLAKEGIRMMVFKGQANASFYPVPEHRATGDIDCWLFGDAEKGDEILAAHGAEIDNRWYRHSKISYKGETIENHRVLSHTRGSKRKKQMEEELVALLDIASLSKIDGCGEALLPPPQFNACFLTYHALHHFTSEGLRMKQILDWAIFLKHEQDKVDWVAFNDFCKRYKLDKFAEIMNCVAARYLGVCCHTNSTDKTDDFEKIAERVIRSTLYDDGYLFNSGKDNWTVRWLLIKNMFGRDRWKYEDIAQESIWSHLYHSAMGFLMDKG